MAELGAFFGNPNIQRQGARARALASQRDVNTLADPLTYAVVQGLLGTRPDEMGFSVLNPDYEKIKKVAEPAFALGLLGQAAPALAPLTKGLPVGASIKNIGNDIFKLSKEEFLGSPKITKNSNASDLKPIQLNTLKEVEPQPFMGGKYEFKMNEDGAVVLDKGKPIASYNFGNTLVVDKAHRKSGIAQELVYEWRTTYPAPAKADMRTKASQDIQEKVWDRIQREKEFLPQQEFAYPQKEALEAAQRNAALPIEEGGLGLPKDNTPEMRAEAMAYDVPAYHATTVWEADDGRKLGDIREFNRLASTEIVGRKPSIDQVGIFASDRPDELGAGMYAGNQGAIYPLMLRMENPKSTSFEQMARTASNLSSGEPLAAGVVPRVSDVEPYRQMLREQGFDSLILRAKQGSPYTEFKDQTGYVLLDPSQIRSRNAAFDPKRRNEADILAGLLPLSLLDEEKRKEIQSLLE